MIRSTGRLAALFLAATLLTLSGCNSLQQVLSGATTPTARISGVRFSDVSLNDLTMLFDVEVQNPYDFPLPLTNLGYTLGSAGRTFLTGQADVQGDVPAKGKRTLGVPAKIAFADLFQTLGGVKPGGVVPYTASLILSVKPPAMDALSLPITREGELPVPAIPEVAVQSIDFKNLSFDNATALMKLKVTNPNSFALSLLNLSYALSLADHPVVQSQVTQKASFAANGGSGTVDVPLSFSPKNLGLAGYNLLTGQGAGYSVGGTMGFDSPFGKIDLPYHNAGETVFKR